ncbi:MAG: SpoIID/LytB domain-containing protein [Actinobacteria bacterium]|nr:SpoIID/LytB domain-containing protein [Actinomycetota bacterium]
MTGSTERARRAATGVAAAAIAAAILVPAQAPAARAAASFTFHGSGWGHGAGISQYGLLGLAKKGWGYRAVLKHYYEGVGIGPASVPSLRIGLVQNQDVLQLTAFGGRVRLRLGSAGGEVVGAIRAGETWTLRAVSNKYVIRDEDGELVGSPVGGPVQHIFATYASGARVFIPQAGHTYNRGHVEFNIYSGVLRAMAVLDMQSYLYGLGEVPSSWPAVALRAQATAARTYALEKVTRLGQDRLPCNCGLLDSVSDQNYVGYDKEAGSMGSRWVAAVDATSGHVLKADGSLIQAFYSSSSGGFSEHSENVFVEKLSYIRATCDPGDYTKENPNRVWKVGPVSADSLTASLASKTGNIGTITGFRKAERGLSDRLLWITVVGETGEKHTWRRHAIGAQPEVHAFLHQPQPQRHRSDPSQVRLRPLPTGLGHGRAEDRDGRLLPALREGHDLPERGSQRDGVAQGTRARQVRGEARVGRGSQMAHLFDPSPAHRRLQDTPLFDDELRAWPHLLQVEAGRRRTRAPRSRVAILRAGRWRLRGTRIPDNRRRTQQRFQLGQVRAGNDPLQPLRHLSQLDRRSSPAPSGFY